MSMLDTNKKLRFFYQPINESIVSMNILNLNKPESLSGLAERNHFND